MLRVDTHIKIKRSVADRVTNTCSACDEPATYEVDACWLKAPMRLCERHTADWRHTKGVNIKRL